MGLILLIITPIGCSRHNNSSEATQSHTVIAVTYPQQAALLKSLTGDDFEIISLLPPGSDPETYEPSMSTMKALSRANLYFSMETPGFEQGVLRGIRENFPDLKIIDSTRGIERLGHTHSHDSNNENHSPHKECRQGDPHLLTSVSNALAMAGNMTETLRSYYPKKSNTLVKRFSILADSLRKADDSIRYILGDSHKSFAISHPSLTYFARDYDLIQISLEKEGKEPSPRQYTKTLEIIKEQRPSILIVERQHSTPRLQEVAKFLQIPIMSIDLNSEKWLPELFKIAYAISNESKLQRETD